MISGKLKHKLLEFRKKRDWEKFHKPKDLAISIVIEASELLENFQWKTDEEVTQMLKDISGEDFLRSADDALYKAKETGRDKLVVSKPEVEQPVLENLSPKKQFREKRGDSQDAPVPRKNSRDEED